MLKPALLCLTLLAREPQGPPGPGSEPPHPGASPLQFPRRRKQQQKARARRRAPSSGHSPGSRAARVTGSEVGKKPNACTNAVQTFTLDTHTHAHTCTEAKNFLAARKRKGSSGEAAGAATAPSAAAAAAAATAPHHPSSGHPHRSHRRCRCWSRGHCSRFILHRTADGRGEEKRGGGRGSGEIHLN